MIVIIGAGIAGLYLGYLLKSLKKDFIIIEKDKRYGGRVYVDDFDGKKVVLGAGIGRFSKDKTLYNLCKKLKVPIKEYKVKISYSFKVKKPLLTYVEEFKKKTREIDRSNINFEEFLDDNDANDFILTSGYTDYIKADVIDTLYNYGFDDNISDWDAFSIDWDVLLDNLYNILKSHIYLEEKVVKIEDFFITTTKRKLKSDKIVCSTPVNIARKLFPSINILKELNCQSFSRIYAKIIQGNELLKEKVENFTIVDSFLQKVIPIDKDKGIYMIGYNDNYSADLGLEYFTTLEEKKVNSILEKEIYKNFKVKVKVDFAKIAYWDYGTTYYLPLSRKYKDRNEWLSYATNPLKNIFFIGEGFSHNQGWVQGALDSVDFIIDMI